jgi:hypothetical protein
MDLIHDARYGWCLLECATRWSGSFDHTLGAQWATGRNLSATLVDYALGRAFDPRVLVFEPTSFVACHTPVVPRGTILGPSMVTTIRYQPEVVDVITTRSVAGDQTTLADRPLFVFARGHTKEAAAANARDAWQGYLDEVRTLNLGGGDH